MKIGNKSIKALAQIVTGDNKLSPYRSGPKLVELFNNYGADDLYGKGFPSRWVYAEEKIHAINDSKQLPALVSEILDPRNYLETEFDVSKALEYINQFFAYDGFQVIQVKGIAKIRDSAGQTVEFNPKGQSKEEDVHVFIDEQITKAEEKIQEGDYDGAITNARSLMEAVLIDIEKALDTTPPAYDGDLPKLYKRVQKLLNLEPGRKDISEPLKQVLSGIISIINGLAGLSNRMGDRHARTYKPAKHHAVLMVNSAKTISNFLLNTMQFQQLKAK